MDPDRGDLKGGGCSPQPAFLCLLIVCMGWAPWAMAGPRSTVVTVTAYNSVAGQTNQHPAIGAWGDRLADHGRVVAVSRDLLSQGLTRGTKVAIQGYKRDYVVLDKMGKGKKKTIDIYMGQDVGKARQFGKKHLRIWWYQKGTSPVEPR